MSAAKPFADRSFETNDAILVIDQSGEPIFQWQSQKPLVPASLTKLLTTHLALQKWGPEHRFHTDFYVLGKQLWVKGFGDPFLISEELELIAHGLRKSGIAALDIDNISIDNSYFSIAEVPGRSSVADPYNAPLSAVAANFNTAKLRKSNGHLVSAEPQTPLTTTARKLARNIGHKATRVNLVDASNAQRHFAELLAAKTGLKPLAIQIDQRLPENARLLYRHYNSHSLTQVLQGALKYSNNFIANQLFLKLAEGQGVERLTFERANEYVREYLDHQLKWNDYQIEEGAGLSRSNRLSAIQVNQLLERLTPFKHLLKDINMPTADVEVYAKTGTLDGVRSYAGFIQFKQHAYRFVFIINRDVPFGFRDSLLADLITELTDSSAVADAK